MILAGAAPAVFSVTEKIVAEAGSIASPSEKFVIAAQAIVSTTETFVFVAISIVSMAKKFVFGTETTVFVLETMGSLAFAILLILRPFRQNLRCALPVMIDR